MLSRIPADQFQLLVGHRRTDGTLKSSLELRMQYLQLTDRLIFKMTDGFTAVDPNRTQIADAIPDAVIYLDKSARPVAWLAEYAWDLLSPQQVGGLPASRPSFYFLNIDRMHWITTVDPLGQGFMDVSRIDPSIIWSLRSIFVEPRYKRAGLTAAIDSAPALLDNKTILIVDEVYSSGRTIDIATGLIRRAFPTSTIGGAHWMGGLVNRGTAVGNGDIPVWYNESSEYGRGVGDRATGGGTSTTSGNITQRLGSWFLSSRLRATDPLSTRLRHELRSLATNPDVPIRPANDRSDVIERLEWLNGGIPAPTLLREISEILGKPLGQ